MGHLFLSFTCLSSLPISFLLGLCGMQFETKLKEKGLISSGMKFKEKIKSYHRIKNLSERERKTMVCIIHTPMCEEGCNIEEACMVSSEL